MGSGRTCPPTEATASASPAERPRAAGVDGRVVPRAAQQRLAEDHEVRATCRCSAGLPGRISQERPRGKERSCIAARLSRCRVPRASLVPLWIAAPRAAAGPSGVHHVELDTARHEVRNGRHVDADGILVFAESFLNGAALAHTGGQRGADCEVGSVRVASRHDGQSHRHPPLRDR
jgi:hypothetical protein